MARKKPDAEAIHEALRDFVSTVNVAGGVFRDREYGLTTYRPIGDPSWTDLGISYIDACAALGVKPVYAKELPSPWDRSSTVPEADAS